MADQTRNGVITALKALLEAVSGVDTVYDGEQAISALPESALPAVCIVEGQSRVIAEITNTRDIVTRFGIQIFYKAAETTARTLDDAIVKKLEQNPTISAAAILSNVMPSETPFLWPQSPDLSFRGIILDVRYRQDTP